jgi:hypothetical protein
MTLRDLDKSIPNNTKISKQEIELFKHIFKEFEIYNVVYHSELSKVKDYPVEEVNMVMDDAIQNLFDYYAKKVN